MIISLFLVSLLILTVSSSEEAAPPCGGYYGKIHEFMISFVRSLLLQIVNIILTISPPVTVWQIANKNVVGPAGECKIWSLENIFI